MKKMDIRTTARCPYCDKEQFVFVEIDEYGFLEMKIVVCDNEDGGCDKSYVVSAECKIHTKTSTINLQ